MSGRELRFPSVSQLQIGAGGGREDLEVRGALRLDDRSSVRESEA